MHYAKQVIPVAQRLASSASSGRHAVPGRRSQMPRRVRRAGLALALSRLEREHVALLMAICELDTPTEKTSANAQALRMVLLPMLREDLRQTQHALQRAATGVFGICEDCHRAISFRQLELRPAATRCPVCEGRTRRTARA